MPWKRCRFTYDTDSNRRSDWLVCVLVFEKIDCTLSRKFLSSDFWYVDVDLLWTGGSSRFFAWISGSQPTTKMNGTIQTHVKRKRIGCAQKHIDREQMQVSVATGSTLASDVNHSHLWTKAPTVNHGYSFNNTIWYCDKKLKIIKYLQIVIAKSKDLWLTKGKFPKYW